MLKSNFGNIHHIVYQNKIEAGKIVVKFLTKFKAVVSISSTQNEIDGCNS